ncbi:CHAT domain-containing protein [Crucibulum laeve]|uniref:CHAT domain-containing protein n=1 Tax=Crucibulum laeve TaxID=68775 RepID=A0A5C3LRJ7_9AGAR|nr:CHAT domain-containing protein [Crucibulum laeve]
MVELQLSSDNVVECYAAVNTFAELLVVQSNYSGNVKCLDIAIVFLKYFLPALLSDTSLLPRAYKNLGASFRLRHEIAVYPEDLYHALSWQRQALDLVTCSHPTRCDILNELGATLLKCFKTTRDINDIDEAISSYENALEITPKSQSQLFIALNGLGAATILKFGVLNETRLLDIGIEWHRKAAAVRTEPCISRALALHGLGWALVNRAKPLISSLPETRTGQMDFLQQSINSLKEATSLLPSDHPQLSVLLHNLGTSMKEVFPHSGRPEDLEAAIENLTHARDLRPEPHPLRHTTLDRLLEHLDDAVALHRDARKLYIEYNGKDEYGNLHNLANAVYTRFRRSDRQEDLLESISLYRVTLSSVPKSHYSRPASLNNLAYALRSHFRRTENIENLNNSIELLQETLQLTEKITVNDDGSSQTQKHPARVLAFNNLGNVTLMRFEIERNTDEVDKAIEWHRAAVALTREIWHNERATFLNDLACSLRTRYSYSFCEKDIREAFALHHESLSLIGQNHPETSKISSDLAKSLFLHYSRTQLSESLDSAVNYFRVSISCESSPMSMRFIAAKEWAKSADSASHPSSLEAYEAAVGLLPLLATLGLDVKFRQEILKSGTDGLARNAANCAIRLGNFEKAVELLEAGRGVFWSQVLQLRTPMDELQDVAPELVAELRSISSQLEQGSHRSVKDGESLQGVIDAQEIHFRNLNEKWSAAIEKVRKLPTFKDFLCPRRFHALKQAANDSPVVILNASTAGCDALIVTNEGVAHMPLNKFDMKKGNMLVRLIQVSSTSNSMRSLNNGNPSSAVRLSTEDSANGIMHNLRMGRPARSSTVEVDDIYRYVLEVLWDNVVQPVIQHLHIQKSATTPIQLHWCPTGLFTFLPIHAAGYYTQKSENYASQYITSSYTPTLGALLIPGRRANSKPTEKLEMMTVIQPKTLPFTEVELKIIESRVPRECLITLGTPKFPASVERVLSNLSTASIAHFACHARQDTVNPLESALVLEDGDLKISRIMQHEMPNASLAFLCACETAMGTDVLPDEGIHLGSTLLFAGFKSVVATMWSISDEDGPKVADYFYEKVFHGGQYTPIKPMPQNPEFGHTARALHHAVGRLRSEGIGFRRWVPFIHIGK